MRGSAHHTKKKGRKTRDLAKPSQVSGPLNRSSGSSSPALEALAIQAAGVAPGVSAVFG